MKYLSPTSINKDNCWQLLTDLEGSLEMSASDLAKTLGVSRSTITRLKANATVKANATEPSIDFLNRLRALNVIGWHQVQKKDPKALALLKKNKITENDLLDAEGKISNIYVAIGILAIVGIDLFQNNIAITDNIVSYGVIQGINKILDANNLVLKKLGGIFEIVSNKFKGE